VPEATAQPEPGQAPQPVAEAVPGSKLKWFFSFNNRYLAPMLITSILLTAHLNFGVLESWGRTLLAIATAMSMELVLGRMMTGKWPHLASSYISGISVGILIRSPYLWPYALCAALSIMSKYVLRWKERHLWNPSNFGVSAMLFLYPLAVASLSIQWDNTIWPMLVIWTLGSIIIMRLKRFHICLSYVAGFLAFSFVRCLITGNPWLSSVAPLTGPMYQLFVFFMITDPKTTVKSKRGQCIVAVMVAFAEMFFRLGEVIHAPYFALFVVGPIALLIEMKLKHWKSQETEDNNFSESELVNQQTIPVGSQEK
jgi:Na+-transporting NADH:ubiquinone oxidoreductase subunit NqrB